AHQVSPATIPSSIDDLIELELLQSPDAVPEWRAARQAAGLDSGLIEGHPRDVEGKLERGGSGDGFAGLPRSTGEFYARPDVTIVEVSGLLPSEVGIAYIERDSSPVIATAVDAAHALRASLTTEEVLDDV